MTDILVVDDEVDIRGLLSDILQDEGYEVRLAANASECFSQIQSRMPHLVVLDIWMKNSTHDGLEVLDTLQSIHADLPVIMISGHGTVELAVRAVQRGAYDFLEKPLKTDHLLLVVKKALESAKLKRENRMLRQKTSSSSTLFGVSSTMTSIRQSIEKVAPTGSRIFISGAPGTGKEIAARMIHEKSKRSDGNFLVARAATLEPRRFEEALFGLSTGSENQPTHCGLLEQAHNGTLFIDEVIDIPLSTQQKLLRFLVDGSFCRLGSSQVVKSNVRVITASCHDIQASIGKGWVREDLYHRLNVVSLHIPSLSARPEDILPLVQHFLTTLGDGFRPHLSEDAMAALQSYPWPGNVRELRNTIEQIVLLGRTDPTKTIGFKDLPEEIRLAAPPVLHGAARDQLMAMSLRDAREVFEREYLMAQLARFNGNISRTSEFIGMERSALHRKLKSLGLSSDKSEEKLVAVS